MNEIPSSEGVAPEGEPNVGDRRLFLQSLGKWSSAAITAVVAGAWVASAPRADAAWVNRRGGGGGGWVNRGGGGGGWVNRSGGGGWINRR